MTTKEYRTSIAKSVRRVLSDLQIRYMDIKISSKYSTVAIGEFSFFAQGESADELISEAEKISELTGLALSTCMVYILDAAGAFQAA